MKKFYEIGRWFQWIDFEGKKIIKINCTCPDFMIRKLKKLEPKNNMSKVRVSGPCKHLKQIKTQLELE